MIDLDLLRTFLAIYRAGSVTHAASQLAITQPAVTGRLKTLEASMRRRLFVRDGRGIAATSAGHDLARSITPFLDGLEAIFASARLGDHGLGGIVRLGGPAEFLSARVLPAIAPLADLGVTTQVTFGMAQQLLDMLPKGELDLAVATIRVRNGAIGYTKLYREEFVLIGAPKWFSRLANRNRINVVDSISALPILAYDDELPIIRRYWREIFDKKPTFRASMIAADLRALVQAAVSGAGITVVPRYLCEEELRDGRLIALHKPPQAPGNDIFMAWNKTALRHPRNIFIRDMLTIAAQGWV